MQTLVSFGAGLVDLLAPPRCLGCDALATRAFCPSCESLVERLSSPTAVFRYGGPVADAIHRYKYEGRSELAGGLGALMGEAARPLIGSVDAVVPVPLHWRRRRQRGFDQAALLARPVARALAVPARLRGLRRVRHTVSQVDLPRSERQENVRGAFECWRLASARRVLLIDDVRTTGATLDAASAALIEGGVEQVRPLVLAARVLCGAS